MSYYPPQSPYSTGMSGKCPRCGQGDLFAGYLKIAPKCEICMLDYGKADSADGPAVFVMFIVGFLSVLLAVVARFVWYAPIWAAFLISAIAAILMTLALLRPLKGVMVALQFQHHAEEVRADQQQGPDAGNP